MGPGDDAAIVAAPDGRTVISIDTQVQDQDFRLEWNNGYRTTGYDVGWKAAAQNLSDINAMGARATSMVVSLTMPPETPVAWVEDFADGLAAAIRRARARRTAPWPAATSAAGRELAVTVAILGTLDGGQPVLRSGRPARGHRGAGRHGGARPRPAWPCWSRSIRVGSLTPEQRATHGHPVPARSRRSLPARCARTPAPRP